MSHPTRHIPFFDPRRDHITLRDALVDAATRVIDSGHYILGPEVNAFEHDLAQYLDLSPQGVVAVHSGTTALLLALQACGVGPGDHVIVPALSFVASASPVLWLGATPVFVDVDPLALTLDPNKVAAALTARTRALIAVHLFGHPADLDRLRAILATAPRPVALIEDVAQAFGGRWQRQALGTLGDVGAVSFYPTKNLGGLGDGGAVYSADLNRMADVRARRVHGLCLTCRAQHDRLGLNARLNAMQAAMLRVKLTHLDAQLQRRRALAERYRQHLHHLDGLTLPAADPEGGQATYNQYVIRCEEREALRQHLSEWGVETKIYYAAPLPDEPVFATLSFSPDRWPVAADACRRGLALPIAPGLDDDEVDHVITSIEAFFTR